MKSKNTKNKMHVSFWGSIISFKSINEIMMYPLDSMGRLKHKFPKQKPRKHLYLVEDNSETPDGSSTQKDNFDNFIKNNSNSSDVPKSNNVSSDNSQNIKTDDSKLDQNTCLLTRPDSKINQNDINKPAKSPVDASSIIEKLLSTSIEDSLSFDSDSDILTWNE